MTSARTRRPLLAAAILAALVAVVSAGPPLAAAAQGSGPAPKGTVTVTEGTSFAVAMAPDGHALAFDLHGTLWVVSGKGGTARALTDNLSDVRLPQWSPDGKTIAFQAYRGGNWHIWTVGEDGTRLTQVTKGDSDNREPAWSPDGRTLYFASDRTRHYEIWRVASSGGTPEQVTSAEANASSPAIDRSGALAYVSRGFARGSATTIKVSRSGAAATDVFQQPAGRLVGLAWLPGGRLSVVQYDHDWTPLATTLLSIDPASGRAEPLTAADADVFPFRASVDAAGAIYYTADGGIRRRGPDGAIGPVPFAAAFPVSRAPQAKRSLRLFDQAPRPVLGIVGPVLSPDGRSVAFTAVGDLWMARDGAAPGRVTNDAAVDVDPAWSPDGKRIAFVSDRSGAKQIWIRDLDTGRDRLVPTGTNPPHMLRWSPDGKRIAFRDPAMQVVDLDTGAVRPIDRSRDGSAPSWSPDGRSVATMAFDVGPSPYREGRNVIEVVDVESGKRQRIEPKAGMTFGARESMGPEWSPDGRSLAVTMNKGLWLVPVDAAGHANGEMRLVAPDVDGGISWDGTGADLQFQAGAALRRVTVATGAVRDVPLKLTWRPGIERSRKIVRAGRVFDGVQQTYRRDVDILIEGNRIVALEARGSAAALRFGGTVIDAASQAVIPGLIDTHAHVRAGDSTAAGRLWLSWGVTTMRSLISDPYVGLEARESLSAGVRPGPRVLYSGRGIDGSRIYYPNAVATMDAAGLAHDLGNAVALDYDLIKTYVRLPNEMQAEVAAFAARHNLTVASHEFYPAVGYGVSSKEHLKGTARDGYGTALSLRSRVYGDIPALLAGSGTAISPTVAFMGGLALEVRERPERIADPRIATFLTLEQLAEFKGSLRVYPENIQALQSSMANVAKGYRRILDGGGRIIAGTDCPLLPCGWSLHTELEISTLPGGLTPVEALLTATAWAADAIGVGDQTGRLAPGMAADLVVVDGDPLARVADARNVQGVMANGRWFTTADLLAAGRVPSPGR